MRTIDWVRGSIKIIDQTKLPAQLEYLFLADLKTLRQAILTMQIRGAPALGAAAGLGVYLGLKDLKFSNFAEFKKTLDKIIDYLGSARPTARNLFWALERMRQVVLKDKTRPLLVLKKLLLEEAQKIIAEDRISCRKIGYYGAKLIARQDSILTLCNTGILATVDYGTALGVIYSAQAQGKRILVFACETRPMLQGARLTTWELKRKKIKVTLICDSMAAALMAQGQIKKVIVGADRIALNGDVVNKVGTYNLAVLSRYHGIPFYVAAPLSTFDFKMSSGKDIPIEQRPAQELDCLFFKHPIAPPGVAIYNPAFDLTPRELITAIITDKGIIKPPYKRNLKKFSGA